jgi:small subunit ribosomal protein S9
MTQAPTAIPEVQPKPVAKPDAGGFFWGTGRRKSSVARVRIRPGEGKFLVNGREVDEYFTEPQHRQACRQALQLTKTEGKLDVLVKVEGGGITGQAGAILLGVARALKAYDSTLEPILRDNGLLTRDPREVERKKPGQPGARKRFQFSKR